MSGHSKWANIQHRKKAQDAKRGKVFTRLIRELTVAARDGGTDPEGNPRLRLAIDKALAANMARSNIDRAIQRASSDADKDNLEEVTYEGFGPQGTAVLVECATDNRNRTVAEVRHVFSRNDGNLGETGSVNYLFNRRGAIYCEHDDEDGLFSTAVDNDADDVVNEGRGRFIVTMAPENLFQVRTALDKAGAKVIESGFEMVATTQVELDDEGALKMGKLMDALEDLDDVQNVHTNASFSTDEAE